jgi:thymidine kinase
MTKTGTLEIIVGNMFSGKSTEMIRRIKRLSSIGKKISVINYIHDNRYSSDSLATHDNITIKSYKFEKLEDLLLNEEYINQTDSFFIDEAQFFVDLYDIVILLVEKYKKHVVVSGLDGDSRRNKFGSILDLIPMCDSIVKLQAYCKICNDGTYAPFTSKIIIDNNVIDIGSSDKYIPVCRLHYS